MSINGQLFIAAASLTEDVLRNDPRLVDDLLLGHDEPFLLDLEGYWHGLHYLLSGNTTMTPGDTAAGQAIITHRHVLEDEVDYWLVASDEVPPVAAALSRFDRGVAEERYEDLRAGLALVNMQTIYDLDSTYPHVFSLLDSLTVFYGNAADARGAVLVSIS